VTRLGFTAAVLHLTLDLGACAAEAAGPRTFIGATGLYGLVPHDAAPGSPQVQAFLQHPHFAGVSVRTGWERIEAVENVYDWSYVDSMIAEAGKHGKRIMLRVRPSWETPDWVYQAGAEPFWYHERNDGGRLQRMPVPWDPVFQARWADFIAELGRRYRANPGLVHVLITGASRSDCEMYLPANSERAAGQPAWEEVGYTPGRMIDAWKQVIDRWAAALPETLTSLSLSSVLYDDGVVEAVAEYCSTRYPWRVAHKISYWSSNNDPAYRPTAAFLSRVDERTHGGVEAVALLSDMPDAARDAIGWRAVLWAEPYPSNRDQMEDLYLEQQRHKEMVLSARLEAAPQHGRVALSWARPWRSEGFEGVRLLRRTDGFPAGPDDPAAVLVHQGKGSSAFDLARPGDPPRYYTLYALPSGYTIAQVTAVPR
jgi:hypothetical protein